MGLKYIENMLSENKCGVSFRSAEMGQLVVPQVHITQGETAFIHYASLC